MGIACLGIVAVDTAKTLKMEWLGWEGWETHEDARNQQQSSFHGQKASKRQTQDCFLAHFFLIGESPDACKEWNWNTFGG